MFGKTRDPVCAAKVSKHSRYFSIYGKRTYYFDCPACRATFEEKPERFSGKGKDKSFLERLAGGDDVRAPKSCHDMKH
ncbi:MAG: YHS domain-containing protein [Nitrospirae bacterium]|nr:YHS domain-containing protein [Nitrospirota bacterium]